jgi:hypothetical protein
LHPWWSYWGSTSAEGERIQDHRGGRDEPGNETASWFVVTTEQQIDGEEDGHWQYGLRNLAKNE